MLSFVDPDPKETSPAARGDHKEREKRVMLKALLRRDGILLQQNLPKAVLTPIRAVSTAFHSLTSSQPTLRDYSRPIALENGRGMAYIDAVPDWRSTAARGHRPSSPVAPTIGQFPRQVEASGA
jgi:hypothetical protein